MQEGEGSLQVTPEKITQLVEFIKRRKVVMVEDVAQRFQMLTKDVIERIAKLEEQGRLSGITDDRGKYIFVTSEEFEKVAQSIEQRGRVSRQDLLKECNRIIRLTPSAEEAKEIEREESDTLAQLQATIAKDE